MGGDLYIVETDTATNTVIFDHFSHQKTPVSLHKLYSFEVAAVTNAGTGMSVMTLF